MRLLTPLQRHWDDVKGDAKWEFFKMIATASPWLSSLGTGVYQYIQRMPWWEFVLWLVGIHVVAWIVAVIVSEIVWYLRRPSLDVTLEGNNAMIYDKDMPSTGCRLFIRNPHAKTLEIASVRIEQMDTNSSRVVTSMGASFPSDLFRQSEGGPRLLHPGETWQLDFLLEGECVTLFEKDFIRARLPGNGFLQFAVGGDYRLRLCILIRNFPMHNERYLLQIKQRASEYPTAYFSRIPRWKKVD